MVYAKKILLIFVLVLTGSFVFSVFYTINLNPENLYFSYARQLSSNWSKKMSEQFDSKYIIFGGSSSRTGINPQILLDEYGIALVNAGLHAGFGAPVLTELALDYANSGDTLIISLETEFLQEKRADGKLSTTSSGNKFLFKEKGFPYDGLFISLGSKDLPQLFMGSGGHNWTMIAKVVTGTPLYRYNKRDNLHESGWMEVKEKRNLSTLHLPDFSRLQSSFLSESGRNYLIKLKKWAQARNIRLLYSMPRGYDHEDARYLNAVFVSEISDYVPVLKDVCLGVYQVEEDYADTGNHLNTKGSEKATRELGRELIAQDFWEKEELEIIVREGLKKAEQSGLTGQAESR